MKKKDSSYNRHRHLCDQMWMALFHAEVGLKDIADGLETLAEFTAATTPDELREAPDHYLSTILRLTKMAVYELSVHGAGVGLMDDMAGPESWWYKIWDSQEPEEDGGEEGDEEEE